MSEHQIYYKYKNALTQTWSTSELVSTESSAFSGYPFIDIDLKGNVHISWLDETDYDSSGTDLDIFYKYWDDSTSAWTTTEVVSTESTGHSYNPSLAVDDEGDVHIAWYDYTDYAGAGGTFADIFYKYWDTSSSTWNNTEVVSTESTRHAYDPSLAVDAVGNVHIEWDD